MPDMPSTPVTTETSPAFDVEALRAQFPALEGGAAHFDGPGGSQTPQAVADAIARQLTRPMSTRGEVTQAERNSDEAVLAARAALGDLMGTEPGGVVFGRSMTALTFEMARTLARGWGPGDEVVVSRLDHDANIRPWVLAAEQVGATVRWAEFDPATGELEPEAVAAVVGERTRLVAVTAASNLIGTMPDLPAIATIAHDVGALLYVDAVHLAPHGLVDRVGDGRRPRRLLALQVLRPALRRPGSRTRAARDAAPRQAGPVVRRGARAVRARDPALRADGRRDRSGRRDRRHRRCHGCRGGARLDGLDVARCVAHTSSPCATASRPSWRAARA